MTRAEGQPREITSKKNQASTLLARAEEMAKYLKAIVDPLTPEERLIAKESRARVLEGERQIRKELPRSTGKTEGLRMTW